MATTESMIFWLDVNKGYPWWPCKMEDGAYVSLQDNCRYEPSEITPSQVRSYNCKELASMIVEGKKKLRKKKITLNLYLDAINEAVQLIQAVDCKFSLDFDPNVSSESQADISVCSSRRSGIVSVTHDNSFMSTSENCPGESNSNNFLPHHLLSPNPLCPTSQERSCHGNVLSQKNGLKMEGRRSSSGVSREKNGLKMVGRRSSSGVGSERKKGGVLVSRRKDQDDDNFPNDPIIRKGTRPPKRTRTLSNETNPPSQKRTRKDGKCQNKTRGRPRKPSVSSTPSSVKQTTTPSRLKTTPTSVALTTTCCRSSKIVEHNTTVFPITPARTETVAVISSSSIASFSQSTSTSSASSSSQVTPKAIPTSIQPTLCGRLGGVSSDDSDEEVGWLDSDSDNDLPSVDLEVKECAKINELKTHSVIWAKVRKYPFWPALISHVTTPKTQRHRSSVFVYFFGYSDVSPYKISQSKNVALFATKHFQDYIADGKLCKDHGKFELAIKEARDFVRKKAEGTYDATRTPRELFRETLALRPLNYDSTTKALLVPSDVFKGGNQYKGEAECGSEAGSKVMSIGSVNKSSDDDDEEEEKEEEEEEESLYTYDRVCKEIKLLEPILVGIVKEQVPSTHHRVFKYGSTKERNQLMVAHKCGPIRRWHSNKVTRLLEETLLVMASVEGYSMAYALDVLLPEAMVRVKAKVENISIEQALEQFQV